jgi:hypothetical protein
VGSVIVYIYFDTEFTAVDFLRLLLLRRNI